MKWSNDVLGNEKPTGAAIYGKGRGSRKPDRLYNRSILNQLSLKKGVRDAERETIPTVAGFGVATAHMQSMKIQKAIMIRRSVKPRCYRISCDCHDPPSDSFYGSLRPSPSYRHKTLQTIPLRYSPSG
jgi:hypothetical protein